MRASRQACLRIDTAGGRRPGGPGFTLAEILVAVGVLLVAFLGVITVYMVGYRDITEGGTDTAAAVAAQTLAESLRNQPQANLPLLDGMDTSNTAGCPGAPGSRINNLCLTWATQVVLLPEGRGVVNVVPTINPNTGVLFNQIIINLTWTEPNAGGRRLVVVAGRSN